jgi:hypothetical protein
MARVSALILLVASPDMQRCPRADVFVERKAATAVARGLIDDARGTCTETDDSVSGLGYAA